MEKYNTLYNWCLLNSIRPLDDINAGDDFMIKEISLNDFKDFLKNGDYKERSVPRKPEKFLELRMYGFVPYNISDIQKGIQFNHANDVYNIDHGGDDNYIHFIKEWKTNIILNGGTSNEGHLVKQGFTETMYVGSMQQHLADLEYNKVKVGTFYEPDLNSMLSAICFLVDERVFNKELYPDFLNSPLPTGSLLTPEVMNEWSKNKDKQYNNWLEKIGGQQNEFLREFLYNKKLA